MPVGSEMDDVLAVSCVELMAWPFVTACVSTWSVEPVSDERSVGEYDLVGIELEGDHPARDHGLAGGAGRDVGLGHDGRRAHGR